MPFSAFSEISAAANHSTYPSQGSWFDLSPKCSSFCLFLEIKRKQTWCPGLSGGRGFRTSSLSPAFTVSRPPLLPFPPPISLRGQGQDSSKGEEQKAVLQVRPRPALEQAPVTFSLCLIVRPKPKGRLVAERKKYWLRCPDITRWY